MFSRKTLFVLTFILAASLILAGCATQSTSKPAAAQAPATEAAAGSSAQDAPTETSAPASTEAPVAPPTKAPTETAAGAPAVTVSFAKDVLPIIESRCVNCHGGDRTEKGLDLTSYAGMMAGSERGLVIVPGDPASSKLVELVANQKMPKRGPKLTPPQVQIISDWVAAGALDN